MERLTTELENLKQLADKQSQQYISAKQLLYEALSKTYLWWADAKKVDGYLTQLYEDCGIQHKKETKNEINFSPLLRYLWGMDGTVQAATLDQWNGALNKMHIEVISKAGYYKTNAVTKLESFIGNSGGITKLAGYAIEPIDKLAETKQTKKTKSATKVDARLNDAHISKGISFFAQNATSIAKFQTKHTLALGSRDIGLALIRKTGDSYSLLETIDDEEMLTQAIVSSYKRNTSQVPNTVRLLAEIISTQILPTSMRTMSAALAENSKYKTADEKTIMKQLKRLMYTAKDKSFILSLNRSECSVVTVAKPLSSIIAAKTDVVLAVGDRTYIENNLIHSGDINFFDADNAKTIPAVKDEAASYKLKLENTVTKRFRYIRWYSPLVFDFVPSRSQVALKANKVFKPVYTAKLDRKWIEEMHGKFLSQWVAGFGKQIKREVNAVFGLGLGKTGISIKFVYKAKEFKEKELLSFAATIATKPISVLVQSKDIIPVLNALVKMEIIDTVVLKADEAMLQFTFKTECANYSISVPCCFENGKRNGEYFEAYGVDNGE
jgi:hypothetical protein